MPNRARSVLVVTLALGLLLATPRVNASTMEEMTPWRFATLTSFQGFFNVPQSCQVDGPEICEALVDSAGQVYTSDYSVAYHWVMFDATDGEVVAVSATTPDGSTAAGPVMTYHDTSDQPGWASWTDQWGDVSYFPLGYGQFITGVSPTCGTAGAWSLSIADNGNVLLSTPFTLSHNQSGLIGISSPTDNQLFDLDQQNYTATGPVQFSAGTNTGNPINWTATLQYATRGGYGSIIDTRTFTGASQSETYQSEGGQVQATASTTASDGSIVKDCTTFYVEGPAGGIPDQGITVALDNLYPNGYSYKKYLSDGTATPNLMTGVAEHESSYRQFTSPGDNPYNSDSFNLEQNFGIDAKWPDENVATSIVPRGAYLGLMQVQTASNQTTDANAWDWTQNATDAVNLFSNGSAKVDDKVQDAVRYEGYIVSGYKSANLPAHLNGDGSYLSGLDALERENNALVLYAGDVQCSNLSCTVNSLYYIPQCPPPSVQITNKQGNLVCQGGTWQWSVNANQQNGVSYVSNVRNSTK